MTQKQRNQTGDTIGGLVITSDGNIAISTSSGGPWLKQPGRVGSSSVKGAGFDVKYAKEEDEILAALASGHGEMIMEHQTCQRALRRLKKDGFIDGVKKFLKGGLGWDLGLLTASYSQTSSKGRVVLI